MEICEQHVHDAKAVAGHDEELCLATSGLDLLITTGSVGASCGIFECAHDSGTNSEKRAIRFFRVADFLGDRFGDFVGLGMDLVVFEKFGVYRLECT